MSFLTPKSGKYGVFRPLACVGILVPLAFRSAAHLGSFLCLVSGSRLFSSHGPGSFRGFWKDLLVATHVGCKAFPRVPSEVASSFPLCHFLIGFRMRLWQKQVGKCSLFLFSGRVCVRSGLRFPHIVGKVYSSNNLSLEVYFAESLLMPDSILYF